MSRKFIATIAAAAITITSLGATTARAADEGEIVGALAGLAALLIIGSSMSKEDKSKADIHVVRPGVTPKRERVQVRLPDEDGNAKRQRVLPRHCLRIFDTQRGPRNLLMRRCMRNHYAGFRRLPHRCERVVERNGHHERRGFALRCLERHGYRLSRR